MDNFYSPLINLFLPPPPIKKISSIFFLGDYFVPPFDYIEKIFLKIF